MLCKRYKGALVEAAASGAAPQGELRAHLGACATCRAAFAEEQYLFSSIDAGLHATANSEVPASLLPRVRAGLGEAAPSPRRWMQALPPAAAGALLAAIIFLATRPHHAKPGEQARQIPSTPFQELHARKTPDHRPETSAVTAASNSYRQKAGRRSASLLSVTLAQPQVIVPPDEREAFLRFVATLEKHGRVTVVPAALAPEKRDVPMSIEPLRIADIDLKPLERQETEVSDHAGEKR